MSRDVAGEPPRRWALATLIMTCVTAAALLLHSSAGHAPHRFTRTAIRVDCTDPAACARAEAIALDVWSEQRGPGLPLDIVVRDDQLAALTAAGVRWQLLVADIDEEARAETTRLQAATAARPGDWFAEYRDFEAIAARLRELSTLAPDRVALAAIGGSVEGRPLWALRIGRAQTGSPRMLITSTEHAREWLAAMATTCVADRLVRDYDRDPAVREFVDHTELWVVPIVNPDGYQYSWGTDRYWRKNRRGGVGVDLNRNFSVGWGGAGASANPRSETYRGAYAFSEPESAAVRDFVRREGVAMHVDFHTYSQLVLYPWTYSSAPAPDRDRLAATGDRIASAIYSTHENRYRLMQGVELYRASGTTTDWMYGEANADSFTIELRPDGLARRGRGGFVQPPAQIRPTCDEALAAVLALRSAAR